MVPKVTQRYCRVQAAKGDEDLGCDADKEVSEEMEEARMRVSVARSRSRKIIENIREAGNDE